VAASANAGGKLPRWMPTKPSGAERAGRPGARRRSDPLRQGVHYRSRGPGGIQRPSRRVLDERTIRRLAQVTFLVVCSGNTCRSPMAEGFCESFWRRSSAARKPSLPAWGMWSSRRAQVPTEGASLPRRRESLGGSGDRHLRAPVPAPDRRVVNRADYILAMTAGHATMVTAMAANAGDRSG